MYGVSARESEIKFAFLNRNDVDASIQTETSVHVLQPQYNSPVHMLINIVIVGNTYQHRITGRTVIFCKDVRV